MYSFQIGKFMLFYEIGLLPKIVFKEMFLMANQVHSILLEILIISTLFPVRINIRLFGIRFQGPKCFNLHSAATISLFKSTLKAFLLS